MAEAEWKAGNPPIRSVRTLLHELWTKAVGTPGYDKKRWGEFESQIEKLMEIFRALNRLHEAKDEKAWQEFWNLYHSYREFVKVDGQLKIDITSGLTEPPPGLMGQNTPNTN